MSITARLSLLVMSITARLSQLLALSFTSELTRHLINSIEEDRRFSYVYSFRLSHTYGSKLYHHPVHTSLLRHLVYGYS